MAPHQSTTTQRRSRHSTDTMSMFHFEAPQAIASEGLFWFCGCTLSTFCVHCIIFINLYSAAHSKSLNSAQCPGNYLNGVKLLQLPQVFLLFSKFRKPS